MNMRKWLGYGLPLMLIALIGLVLWQSRQRPATGVTRVVCATLAQGCQQTLGGRSVSLGIAGTPRPLQPFDIWVKASDVAKVQARFTMEGMDMGFNLYTLRRDAAGVYRASVTLPVCVSGQRGWVMTLDLDGDLLAVPFVTDL